MKCTAVESLAIPAKAIAMLQYLSENIVMTSDELWLQLLKLVEESVPKRDVNHQPQVLWQRPNDLTPRIRPIRNTIWTKERGRTNEPKQAHGGADHRCA
jgi:hypothetical protein